MCAGNIKKENGFTLLELLITVSIAGLLAMTAIPSMVTFIQNENLVSKTNELLSHFRLARSLSIKENSPVILCTSTNGSSCTNTPGADGWIIFIDSNDSGSVSTDEEIVKVNQKIDKMTITSFGSIVFNNRGFSPDSNQVISLCDDRGVDFAKAVTLSKTGQAISKGTPVC